MTLLKLVVDRYNHRLDDPLDRNTVARFHAYRKGDVFELDNEDAELRLFKLGSVVEATSDEKQKYDENVKKAEDRQIEQAKERAAIRHSQGEKPLPKSPGAVTWAPQPGDQPAKKTATSKSAQPKIAESGESSEGK